MPSFHALNGEELIEVIGEKVKEDLRKSGKFKRHLTHPLVRYMYKIDVATYPVQALDQPGHIIEGQGEYVLTEEGGDVIEKPDMARSKAKLPIPVVVTTTQKTHVTERK